MASRWGFVEADRRKPQRMPKARDLLRMRLVPPCRFGDESA